MKNRYLGYCRICRILIEYLCESDVGNFDSRFVDSDGDGFVADMGYFLDGLRAAEEYFRCKFESDGV